MDNTTIANKIISVLTKEELSYFCTIYDEDSLDDVMIILFKKDQENFPSLYAHI